MVPVEIVARPSGHVWCLWQPLRAVMILGTAWRNKVCDIVALHLSESDLSQDLSVWSAVTDAQGEKRHYMYLDLHYDQEAEDFMENFTLQTGGSGTMYGCQIPDEAEPVLLRKRDGQLIRLWATPGPTVPVRQTLRVEWGRFTIENRVYQVKLS